MSTPRKMCSSTWRTS